MNAGGNGGRSVWLVRSTEDDVAIVAGNDGQLKFDFDPESVQFLITDTSTGAGYNALSAALGGWFAVQYGSRYSLGRIDVYKRQGSTAIGCLKPSGMIQNFPPPGT